MDWELSLVAQRRFLAEWYRMSAAREYQQVVFHLCLLRIWASPFTMPNAPPSSSMPTAPQTPVMVGAIPGNQLGSVPAPECIFAGYSPRAEGENAMTVGLNIELPEKKSVPVLLKCQNRFLPASPTSRRAVPSSFLAHQAPLGWVRVPPSSEIRRVYNVCK